MSENKPCDISCCKCGSEDIRRKFFAKGEDPKPFNYGQSSVTRLNQFVDIKPGNSTTLKQCIVHHCKTCDFEWETAPLKAKK